MMDRHHYRESDTAVPHDPLLIAARLAASSEQPYVLYERQNSWAYSAGELARIVVDDRQVHYRCGAHQRSIVWRERPLQVVAELLEELPVAGWRAYGWAAFELATAMAGGRLAAGRGPLLHLVVPRTEVRIAHGRALLRTTDAQAPQRLASLLAEPVPAGDFTRTAAGLELTTGADQYRKMVAEAVAEITTGALDKVVLSRVVPVPYPIDMPATFVLGRRGNTPARSFLLQLGGVHAAGFSPELVVSVDTQGRVRTQPLAGTRARTADAAEDRRLRQELLACPKELYEHRISVEAARDDLAAVCEAGSVTVEEYLAVKQRGSVQHLASYLSGRLAPGRSRWDAFEQVFPAVTVTGVPKPAALQAIARHETTPRGLYGGAVLVADADGALEAALVLRTVFAQHGHTWLRAGAGIVRQSVAARELEETCEKLRSVAGHLVPAVEG